MIMMEAAKHKMKHIESFRSSNEDHLREVKDHQLHNSIQDWNGELLAK